MVHRLTFRKYLASYKFKFSIKFVAANSCSTEKVNRFFSVLKLIFFLSNNSNQVYEPGGKFYHLNNPNSINRLASLWEYSTDAEVEICPVSIKNLSSGIMSSVLTYSTLSMESSSLIIL